MKNHFMIAYSGNKRNECVDLYNEIKDKIENIKYIIEPFCGSSAFSYYMSLQHPKKFKYILNDNDNFLIELYETARDETKLNEFVIKINNILIDINKEKYDKLNKNELIGWFIHHKIYCIRPGLFPLESKTKTIKRDITLIKNSPIIKFLRTESIIFKNIDGIDIINEYKNNNNCLIFIDPPYLLACNDMYKSSKVNVYEYLYINKITDFKSIVLLCLESNWIINLLFSGLIKKNYNKLYQLSKKKTNHLIISNI